MCIRDSFNSTESLDIVQGSLAPQVTLSPSVVNLQHEETITFSGYIFNPTDSSGEYSVEVLSSLDFGKSLYMSWPGEQSGKLEHYDKWTYDQQATIGYGYGLSTTLLHLANAYVILANYGKKVQLSYEKKMQEDIYYEDVLDKNISKNIIQMMKSVVGNQGTAINAKLDKYSVAGKTGTAKESLEEETTYSATFAGFVPHDEPELLAVVVLNGLSGEDYSGGRVSAPVFSRLMQQIFMLQDLKI